MLTSTLAKGSRPAHRHRGRSTPPTGSLVRGASAAAEPPNHQPAPSTAGHRKGGRRRSAPNPQEFCLNACLADWSGWVGQGLADEVVVQIYRNSAEAVARELASPSLAKAAARVPLRIGLLAGLRHQPKAPATLQQEVALLRKAGVAGIDLFFYESARQHFPAAATAPSGLSASPDPARPAPHPQSPPPAPDR